MLDTLGRDFIQVNFGKIHRGILAPAMDRLRETRQEPLARQIQLCYANDMRLWSVFSVLLIGAAACAAGPVPAPLPADVAGLVASMARDDFAGQAACEQLVKMGKTAVPDLLPALQHQTPRVRYWSAAALCRIADDRAWQPLVTALRDDPSPVVRSTILWHLQHFSKNEVYGLAAERLADPDPLVRGWALKTLAHGRQRDRLAMVIQRTNDKEPGVRHDALVAAVELGGNTQLSLIQKMAGDDPDPQVREGALRCLTLLPAKSPVILAVMIRGLADKDPDVQAAAARLLAKGTNQSFGFDPARLPAERARVVAAWQQWFEQNKDRLRWSDEKRRFVLPGEERQ
jgi:hypothetical protein